MQYTKLSIIKKYYILERGIGIKKILEIKITVVERKIK